MAHVRSILRRAAKTPAPSASPTGTPIQIDDSRRQIRFYRKLLELSRYEYGLLKTLASRPGHVFTRDMLFERVWDDPGESLGRTVDAHVKTLRAKMKLVASMLDPIRTHRGTGYALAEDMPGFLSPS